MKRPSRREFLGKAAGVSGALALGAPLAAFARHGGLDAEAGYGPLEPRPDENTGAAPLALPRGFRYWSIGAAGSPMSDGRPTPPAHDGTAAFASGSRVRLVRNHECRGGGPAFGPAEMAYDPEAPGGTTTLVFDPAHPERPESFASLSGTSTNCAGGLTPWGSWLTCEETFHETRSSGRVLRHGYVFEVPSAADRAVPATPLRALGRFVHEAVAVDPETGIVYQTEDADAAGFFRFVPEGGLAAGRLQMLAVSGRPNADTRGKQTVGRALPASWLDVDEPDPAEGQPSCHRQGFKKGAAVFRRLEGAWWSPVDRAVYFTATDGGDARAGQVWAFRPAPGDGTLTLVYESPSPQALFKPDNITVSPTGGLLVCEDPDGRHSCRLQGLSREGTLFPFAADRRPGPGALPGARDEFTGACFSPDGTWLFVNLQGLGVTFAITGPFSAGPLGRS
ncbi:MAG TPA: alkaline phosphatase PhoX [Vicinamibacteria bacterium]